MALQGYLLTFGSLELALISHFVNVMLEFVSDFVNVVFVPKCHDLVIIVIRTIIIIIYFCRLVRRNTLRICPSSERFC